MKSRLLIIIGILVVMASVTIILTMNFFDDKKTTILDNTPEQLKAVLGHCIDSKDLADVVGLSYYNDTHFIDTITCEWQTIDQGKTMPAILDKIERNESIEGIIIDQRLSNEQHEYHFFTNDLPEFDTGSLGIQLVGVDQRDDLDGKYVKLSGTVSKKGEEIITVDDIQILYSIIPSGIPFGKVVQQVSIDEIHANPDKYYNQMITVYGELREHDADVMMHMGTGCFNAKFTTSDEFVAEFISSQLLYDDKGEKHLGVRLGSVDNIGISKLQRLPSELKNSQVELNGVFVPAIKDNGNCVHTVYKSGYILTDYDKIKVVR